MTASVGSLPRSQSGATAVKTKIFDSIVRVTDWVERNDYKSYDTFDGLNAKFIRPFLFNNKTLLQVLQQGVRRFPINLRPVLGISRNYSSKGMGFLARGFLRDERNHG